MRKLLQLFFLCLLSCSASWAQTHDGYIYDAGTPAYSVNFPVENGYINVANGNLHMEFPIGNLPQRGALKLNERLIYDSHWWKIGHYSNYYWWPDNLPRNQHLAAGWRFMNGASTGSLQSSLGYYNSYPCGDDSGNYNQNGTYNFTWQDELGTSHTFENAFNFDYNGCYYSSSYPESNSTAANDSSGLVLTVSGDSASGPSTYSSRNASGTQVYPTIADRYGNFWSTDGNGDLVDNRGQTPVVTTYDDASHKIYFDVLRQGGGRVRYTITTVQVSPHTFFAEGGVSEYPNGGNAQLLNAVQSIQLPDGTQYSFEYDPIYAMITKVTLPTGGVIRYSWANFQDSYNNKNRWLTYRYVGNDSPYVFTPAVVTNCNSNQTDCHEKVTLRKPNGDESVYDQRLNNGAWNTTLYQYGGSASSGGTLLTTTTTDYNFSTSCGYSCNNQGAKWIVSSATTTTQADTGFNFRKEYQYQDNSLGLLSKERRFDVYQGGVPSQPLAQTEYKYEAYDGIPADVTEIDQEDGGGNAYSKTKYSFTNTATATSGLAQHDTSLSANAYLSTMSEWAEGEPNDWHTTTYTMDDAGMVLSKQLSIGTTTYPAEFFTADASDSFVKGSSKVVNGITLSTDSNLDATSGLPSTSYDLNGNPTGFPSYDEFGRIRETDYADGGVTKTDYDARHVVSSVKVTNVKSSVTETELDEFGRKSRSLTSSGQPVPWRQQDTCYNALGQMEYQSVPYLGQGLAEAKRCSGTHSEYDALGRVKQVTTSDGPTTYTYSGRATLVTDTNGKQKITQVDGLGRTTAVCEVTSSTDSGTPQDCGLDIAGTGFLTTYAYNVRNRETQITQGAQTRTFRTDSLGRPTYSKEPEKASATTHSYDVNAIGTVETITSPAPNGAGQQTARVEYDTLGRTLSVKYNGSTNPSKSFSYDQAFYGIGIPWGNVKGQLTFADGVSGGATWLSYDKMGRVHETVQCFPGRCGASAHDIFRIYDYDKAGNRILEESAVGSCCTTHVDKTTSYDSSGNVTSISSTHDGTLLSNIGYDISGPTTYVFGNGLNGYEWRDELGRSRGRYVCTGPSAYQCNQGGDQRYGTEYAYSGPLVTGLSDTILNTNGAFTYDDMNRLKTASFPISGRSMSWTYDRYGNRQSQNNNMGSTSSLSFDAGSNRINGATYSAAGNLLSDGVHTYTYDEEGNVLTVDGGASYAYDAFNHRVRAASKFYAFNVNGQRVSTWDATTPSPSQLSEQFYWNDKPLAYRTAGSGSAGVTGPANYIRCADELGTCTLPKIGMVAFGRGDSFNYVPVGAGSVTCNTANFGDPAFGQAKACFYSLSNGSAINPPDGYTFCSFQNETCVFSGTADVAYGYAESRYGYTGDYTVQSRTGGAACNDSSFGDPAPGLPKACYYKPTSGDQPSGPPGYIYCGDENGYCTTAGGFVQIAYGANGSFFYTAQYTSSFPCNNNTFGEPVSGVTKHCFYSISNGKNFAGPAGSVFCAVEGQRCSFSGSAKVAYGFDGRFATSNVTNGVNCDDNLGDPYPGLIKACYYTPLSAGGGDLHFQHQDLLGTERVRTNIAGITESFFRSLPFGDDLDIVGADSDASHYAMLDHDSDSQTEHADFRQYSSALGRWMSPDPANGSYDPSDPQSLNRFSYVNNNPFAFKDPSGLYGVAEAGSTLGFACGPVCGIVGSVVGQILDHFLFASRPAFHGSVTPRPGQVWTEHSDFLVPNSNLGSISGLLNSAGVTAPGCDFGGCGSSFQSSQGNKALTSLAGGTFIDTYGLSSLLRFAYHDSTDPNLRLFRTHFCGPGGGGGTTGGLDQLCAAHDACYRSHGVSALDNFNPFTAGEGMGSCDRLLCASLEHFQPTSPAERSGKDHIQQIFGCSYISRYGNDEASGNAAVLAANHPLVWDLLGLDPDDFAALHSQGKVGL